MSSSSCWLERVNDRQQLTHFFSTGEHTIHSCPSCIIPFLALDTLQTPFSEFMVLDRSQPHWSSNLDVRYRSSGGPCSVTCMLHLPTALTSLARRSLLRSLVLWVALLLHDSSKWLRLEALTIAANEDDSRFADIRNDDTLPGPHGTHLDTSLTKRGAVSTVTKTRT